MNIGFIGAGNMGGALAYAISANKEINVYIFDTNKEKSETLSKSIGAKNSSIEEICSCCDFIFLGVKPYAVCTLAKSIRGLLNPCAVIVSMAAGVKISKIKEALNNETPVIRIMPNTPVTLGKGMSAWCSFEIDEKMAKKFESIMAYTGALSRIEEEKIDAFCAIAGCGPAYTYMFIDALANAGEALGLSREESIFYASEMMIGAAEMALKSGKDPLTLRENVCSPGGSTIEGVKVLQNADFEKTVADAISAAFKRTKELGSE